MLRVPVTAVSLLLLSLTVTPQTEATLRERLLLRRQTGESEQESTTPKNQGQQQQQQQQQLTPNTGAGQQPPRLYPDLAHPPGVIVAQQLPPPPPYGPHYPPNHGPTPFVPFGLQLPTQTNRFNGLQNNALQPRPILSPSERLQSQTFTNGLGRRLLSLIGLDTSATNETTSGAGEGDTNHSDAEDTMKVLQNATVLQQLSKGVQSIYGSLSKMYNSTVQQQLDLLQERFRKETENSTSPWQQRMAQQVPMFFKSMAIKVEDAQANLNRIWRQVTQANNGTIDQTLMVRQQPPQSPFLGPNDQLMGALRPDQGGDVFQTGSFFNQIGRSFGFGSANGPNDPQHTDIRSQMMEFWRNQVQPQIGMVRGQIARVWRDLTASGVYSMDSIVRSRNNANNLGASSQNDSSASSDIVDDILKSVDMSSSEYSIVEPKAEKQQGGDNSKQQQQQQQQQQRHSRGDEISAQFQNRLVAMQRELNQLWNGLSSSIQGALGNVKSALNPRPQFSPLDTTASNDNKQDTDPAQNEIDDKIRDLGKLQRDADVVYDAVQKQQQAQQRPSFTDRFRNFIGNVDFGNVDQLHSRIGESMSRFGTVVGDLWHQIPTRWENFMQNVRQQDPINNVSSGRLTASSSTTLEPTTVSASAMSSQA